MALSSRARVAAAEGEPELAERDAREALAVAAEVDAHLITADALECLAGLLEVTVVIAEKTTVSGVFPRFEGVKVASRQHDDVLAVAERFPGAVATGGSRTKRLDEGATRSVHASWWVNTVTGRSSSSCSTAAPIAKTLRSKMPPNPWLATNSTGVSKVVGSASSWRRW